MPSTRGDIAYKLTTTQNAAEAPWGAPGSSFQPGSPEAARRRSEAVAKLVAALKPLIEATHECMFEGSLGPGEYSILAENQEWLGALLAEQEPRGGRRAPRPRAK